jgi:hypothetical protein
MIETQAAKDRKMTDANIDKLGTIAANAAMESAAAYLAKWGMTKIDYRAATEIIRRHVRAALDKAFDEAGEAFACGMDEIASATFLASMRLAGIAAAKEIAATN